MPAGNVKSTHVPLATVPIVASAAPVVAGALAHVNPVSVQPDAVRYSEPPSGPPSDAHRRTVAPVTVRPARPATLNRR